MLDHNVDFIPDHLTYNTYSLDNINIGETPHENSEQMPSVNLEETVKVFDEINNKPSTVSTQLHNPEDINLIPMHMAEYRNTAPSTFITRHRPNALNTNVDQHYQSHPFHSEYHAEQQCNMDPSFHPTFPPSGTCIMHQSVQSYHNVTQIHQYQQTTFNDFAFYS